MTRREHWLTLLYFCAGLAMGLIPTIARCDDSGAGMIKWSGDYKIQGPTYTISEQTVRDLREGTILRVRDGKLEIVDDLECKPKPSAFPICTPDPNGVTATCR